MKKSYYDKKKNKYIDTTTNREYIPKGYCEICKSPYFFNCTSFLKSAEMLKRLERKESQASKNVD